MKQSKSSTSIKILLGHSSGSHDINSNFILTDLIGAAPCHRTPKSQFPDAYDQAQKFLETNQTKNKCQVSLKAKSNKDERDKKNHKRAVSQEDVYKLVFLESELKEAAQQSLFCSSASGFRTKMNVTPKDVKQIKVSNISQCSHKNEMLKRVMLNSKDEYRKQLQFAEKIKKSLSKNDESMHQAEQSWAAVSFSVRKTTNESVTEQENEFCLKKKHFQKQLSNKQFQMVYDTERRKQAWIGFSEAGVQKVKRNQQNKETLCFTNKPLKIKKKTRGTRIPQDHKESQTVNHNSNRNWFQNFDRYTSHYRLSLNQ